MGEADRQRTSIGTDIPSSQYSRPRVSISGALPPALASRGILLPWACGWHLLGHAESARGVIPFRWVVLRDRRAALSAGFHGGEDQSLDSTPAPILDHFGPSSSTRVSLFDVTMGQMGVCLRCP